MPIKHAVISGGGTTFFSTLGAVQQLEKNGIWNINEIESIYGTSAGGIAAVVFCLKFNDWTIINDYFIKRPWHDAFPIHAGSIFDAYSKRGIFDKKFIEIIFKSLFNAKDIPLDITMEQFYKYSNIELHLYSVELHDFQTVDISYKTHPNMELLTAVYMSSAIPILFAPYCIDNKCYMDGGIITNYPLKYCIDIINTNNEKSTNEKSTNEKLTNEKSSDEIIGFINDYEKDDTSYSVNENSTIIDFIMCFLYKLIYNVSTDNKQKKIKNEIIYKTTHISISYSKQVLSSQEIREELLERGKEAALDYFGKITNNIKIPEIYNENK